MTIASQKGLLVCCVLFSKHKLRLDHGVAHKHANTQRWDAHSGRNRKPSGCDLRKHPAPLSEHPDELTHTSTGRFFPPLCVCLSKIACWLHYVRKLWRRTGAFLKPRSILFMQAGEQDRCLQVGTKGRLVWITHTGSRQWRTLDATHSHLQHHTCLLENMYKHIFFVIIMRGKILPI